MKTQSIKIIPLRADFLNKVRRYGIDDQNQPVERLFAKGGEACRDVLRAAKPNESIILASYCPFTKTGPYKEYGPVFVLADDHNEKFDSSRLPLPVTTNVKKEDEESIDNYLNESFVLKGYCQSERIVDAQVATSETAQTIITSFFENDEIDFVMARYTAFGCYSFRVERG